MMGKRMIHHGVHTGPWGISLGKFFGQPHGVDDGDVRPIIQLKQCHKPPIREWFLQPIYGDLGDGLLLFYPHESYFSFVNWYGLPRFISNRSFSAVVLYLYMPTRGHQLARNLVSTRGIQRPQFGFHPRKTGWRGAHVTFQLCQTQCHDTRGSLLGTSLWLGSSLSWCPCLVPMVALAGVLLLLNFQGYPMDVGKTMS